MQLTASLVSHLIPCGNLESSRHPRVPAQAAALVAVGETRRSMPVRVAVFSTKPYDRTFLERANARHGHDLIFFEPRLTQETAALAAGFPAVCVFVNDFLDARA